VRVVFLGTPRTAVPFLDALIDAGHDVPLVVTRPDRPVGRSADPRPTPVKARALALGLEVVEPNTARGPRFLARLADARPDLLVVVAYGRILRRAVLDVAPHGAINIHFSLLPRLRGAAPVQWALARGETLTGVSAMRLDEGMDTGDVLGTVEVPIRTGEHAPALQERLVEVGTVLLAETVHTLAAGTATATPQDHAAATHAPMLTRDDGHVDPAEPAPSIEGKVRGFDPWPGVWVARGERRVRWVEARAVAATATDAPPGTVLGLDGDGLRVACGEGTVLEVLRLQCEGRRPTAPRDAINGRQIAVGDRLGRLA
jgi:methionyl-tRNA formyltransferase